MRAQPLHTRRTTDTHTVRAGSHTGTRLRSSFNLCQSVMGRSQLPVCRLLRKRQVHGPFGQRAPRQSWIKSLIPPRRRRRRKKRSPRGLLRRGPRPRRRPRKPSRTRMQRTRAMALQSMRYHPLRVGRPHAVRMHVPTPMLLSTRGRCFARSWHARTHTHALRVIARCQNHAGGVFACQGQAREKAEDNKRKRAAPCLAGLHPSGRWNAPSRGTQTHIRTHAQPLTRTHARARARKTPQTPTHLMSARGGCTDAHKHVRPHTHTHTYTHTQARTYHTHARARMTTPTCVRAAKAARSLSRAERGGHARKHRRDQRSRARRPHRERLVAGGSEAAPRARSDAQTRGPERSPGCAPQVQRGQPRHFVKTRGAPLHQPGATAPRDRGCRPRHHWHVPGNNDDVW